MSTAHLARAALLRLAEPPRPELASGIARWGPEEMLAKLAEGTAPPAVQTAADPRIAGRDRAELLEAAATDLRQAERHGAVLCVPEDPSWPSDAFLGWEMAAAAGVSGAAAPIAVYVRGRELADHPAAAVTVVGSRACTGYGARVAGEISADLAEAGRVIVSGGALGIDTAAHRAALAVGGRTTAVLACGIDKAYPVANTGLLAEIASNGAVISEYPPGAVPARHRFLVRNRLIAALGEVTVVVEAGRRSGALSTATAAEALGRVVLAVPGSVHSAMSVGTHLLLRDRCAVLATDADDVLAVAGPLDPAREGTAGDLATGEPVDELDGPQRRVWESLPLRAARTVSEIAATAGLAERPTFEYLAVLELFDLVERVGPRYRRRAQRH